MITCPNIKHPDYIKLEAATDRATAHYYWNKFDGFEEYSVDDLLDNLNKKYRGNIIRVGTIKGNQDVLKNLLYNYNLSIDKIKDIINNEKGVVDFLVFKELSRQSNPDKKNKLELEARSILDALNELRTDITKPEFKDKTINDIKIFIQEAIDRVKKDTVIKDTTRIKKLEDLQKAFEDSHQSEKVKIFIDYYHNNIRGTNNNGFVYKFDNLIKKTKETKDPEERRKLLRDIVYYYNYAESLDNILSDIDKDLAGVSYNDIINADKGTTLKKLQEINQDRNRILNITKEVIPELFAEQMLPYVSDKAQQKVELEYQSEKKIINKITDERLRDIKLDKLEEKYKDLRRDKQSLIDAFKSFKDQRIEEYWTSPTISSSDPLLSTFAKFIKEKFEEFRLTLFQFEKKAANEFTKFKKWNKRSVDNIAKFNEDLYEIVNTKRIVDVIDSNGVVTKELQDDIYYSFVNTYDISKYNTALNTMLMKASELEATKGKKVADKFKAMWYSENTEPKSKAETDEILAAYERDLSKEDFAEWKQKYNPDNQTFRGPLAQPKMSLYSNPKYDKILKTPELKEYYNFLTKSYLNAQGRLPASDRMGMRLPSIPKTSKELAFSEGWLGVPAQAAKTTKDIFVKTFKKSEIDYDTYSRDRESKINRNLPVYYTKKSTLEDTSLDLLRSVLKFEQMSLKFKTGFDIKNEIKAASIVADNRIIEKVDSKGMRFLSQKAKELGISSYITDENLGNSAKWMEAFIDMQIFNKMKEEEYLLGVRADKIGDFMMKQASFSSIGIPNIMKSTVNNLQANTQIAIEAWSKDYLSYKDLWAGRAFYSSKVTDMGKDFGKLINTSFTNQLIEVFDPLQGEWLDTYGNKMSGSKLARDFTLGLGYALQNAGEHQAQVSMMFGMMNTIKLKHDGKDITLLDAYELDENGKFKLKEGIDEAWNPFIPVKDEQGNIIKYEQGKEFKDFVNKVHAINKRLHGVYNKFDKASIERFTAGRLVMFFRKFVIPGLKKRYKKLGVDEELGDITEGTYVTLWNSITKQRKDLFKFLLNNENELTEFQKKNIKRSLVELTYILGLMTLSGLLNAYDDDDDTYAYNFLQYEAYRLQSEMQFYLNPVEFYRVLRTPTIAATKTEQMLKFTSQLGLQLPPIYDLDKGEFYINEKFEKDVGMSPLSQKGDNKAVKYGLNVLGLDLNNQDPEYALDMYQKLTKK
jgi:hypothetical protein